MRAVVRSIVAIGVLGGLVVAVPQTSAGADRGRPPVPELSWGPCGDDYPGAECAVAVVPLDYDNPRAGTTEIALARIPASDPANRIGSVFVNPGGPGASGVELALLGFGEFLGANLGGRFDVVGFDPRGVGASDPLHCFDSEAQLVQFFTSLGPLFPYEHAQYRPYYEAFRSMAPECLDDERRIAGNMSTADVARDLDLLREAVGDRKLTYLGFSYGSHLGNTYANLFPHNVRALVIDGVLDPRLWSSGWQITSDRVATQAVLDEFLRLCDEAGPECAFSAPEGSAARWDALAAALRQEPLVFPDGFAYTYDQLIGDAASAMYVPEFWGGPDGAAALFDFLADAVLGDQGAAVSAAAARAAFVARIVPPAFEADYDNGFDAYFGNHCADAEYPSSFLAWRLVDLYAAAGSAFGPLWWWGNTACADWPVNRDRHTGPWTARTSAPVLVVGNHFDPSTDFAGAQASAQLLRNSRLLAYAGWGHTVYGRNECTTAYIDAYLVDVTLPPRGTVCPANPNPFIVSAARAAAVAPLVGLPTFIPARG